jgi:hypothetical protein
MAGSQLGGPAYPPPRRLLHRDGKRTAERHPPERFPLFAAFDPNQPIVRFAEVDDRCDALGVTALGFVQTALNSLKGR